MGDPWRAMSRGERIAKSHIMASLVATAREKAERTGEPAPIRQWFESDPARRVVEMIRLDGSRFLREFAMTEDDPD